MMIKLITVVVIVVVIIMVIIVRIIMMRVTIIVIMILNLENVKLIIFVTMRIQVLIFMRRITSSSTLSFPFHDHHHYCHHHYCHHHYCHYHFHFTIIIIAGRKGKSNWDDLFFSQIFKEGLTFVVPNPPNPNNFAISAALLSS